MDNDVLWRYQAQPGLLDEHVVLVTGASRGIGRAVSLAAAAHGASLILLARDVKALRKVADEITSAGGANPTLLPMNLEGATVDDYQNVADNIADRYGHLDALVLNASMLGMMAPLASYEPVTWARVFQVNVHSQFLMLQSLLPLLEIQGGSVLFTSSGVGRKSRAYWGAYAATKFATEGMMQTLADELDAAGRVRANCINPGRLRTKMRAEAYPAEDPNSLRDPLDVVQAYLYLLGPDSEGVNGCSFDAQEPTK